MRRELSETTVDCCLTGSPTAKKDRTDQRHSQIAPLVHQAAGCAPQRAFRWQAWKHGHGITDLEQEDKRCWETKMSSLCIPLQADAQYSCKRRTVVRTYPSASPMPATSSTGDGTRHRTAEPQPENSYSMETEEKFQSCTRPSTAPTIT